MEQQGGSEPALSTTDIRLHPQFQYFKAFYEDQVKEMRKKSGVPESSLPSAQFIPPKPKAPIIPPKPKYQPAQRQMPRSQMPSMPSQGSQMPRSQMPSMPSQGSQMPRSQMPSMPSQGSQMPSMPSQGSQMPSMPSQGSQMPSMPSQGYKSIMQGIPGIFSQGPQSPQSPQSPQGPQSPQMLAPALNLLQMMKPQTGGGPLEDIQRRGEVKRNPPLAVEDAYLLQQYTRPSIRPDMKFHGMVQSKPFTPRPFYKSDIPQLNPYALINDDGSGYELGKLYAYDRNSF